MTDLLTAPSVGVRWHQSAPAAPTRPVGYRALYNNLSVVNTAIGTDALFSNTAADLNTTAGAGVLRNTLPAVTTRLPVIKTVRILRSYNTATGNQALHNNTTGSSNTALGFNARNGITTASNVICIGTNIAGANVNSTCYIRNIWGKPGVGSEAVYVSSAGKLGYQVSSRRFKDEIKPMKEASEVIYSLEPGELPLQT